MAEEDKTRIIGKDKTLGVDFLTKHITIKKTDSFKKEDIQNKLSKLAKQIHAAKEKIKETEAQLAYKMESQKYRCEEEIGQGGMGIVYRVTDQELHRELAMKVLSSEDDIKDYKKTVSCLDFLKEAQIAAYLEHPNIIFVHDFGISLEKNFYFTMQIVRGEDLSTIINQLENKVPQYIRNYSLHSLLTIFRKVCDAVAFAHSRGVIHRDIKPENIMIGPYGEVILMDWGVAKYVGTTDDNTPEKHCLRLYEFYNEKEDVTQGTPWYMSPEQITAPEEVDYLSDIYLLGATLYHALTLCPPHDGETIKELFENVISGDIPLAHKRSPRRQIPEELSNIVAKAMSINRDERYQSVEELSQDIDNFMNAYVHSAPVQFDAGEYLMRWGETGNSVYVLLNGKVEVFRNVHGQNILLTTLGPGDVVGEMAIISSDERSADVVATEDTEVLVINDSDINQALNKMAPWMQKIIKKVVERLRKANSKMHRLLIDDPDYHILKQLAAISCLQLQREGKTDICELEIGFDYVIGEIVALLCIPKDWVRSTLTNLFTTELCELTANRKLCFLDFSLFCSVVDFMHELFGIVGKGYDKKEKMSREMKIKCCQIAANISKPARMLLENNPEYKDHLI